MFGGPLESFSEATKKEAEDSFSTNLACDSRLSHSVKDTAQECEVFSEVLIFVPGISKISVGY